MKRAGFVLAVSILLSAPLMAQTSEFGFLLGGSKRMNDVAGTQGQSGINDFKFGNSVREAFFSTALDPETTFRIKVGQIRVPLIYTNGTDTPTVVKGTIDHIDALVDYRFSEPFGSTGLFGGVGMYRQSASGQQDDTNVGLSFGVNADLPITRRYGIVGEATYHWMHTLPRQRLVTLTGGLRISF